MTQDRPRQAFSVIVTSKAEEEDGFVIDVEIPAFHSQYPIKLTRVGAPLAGRLIPGRAYDVLLERQNLKRGKSGTQLYDYYWGMVEFAAEGEAESPAYDTRGQPKASPAAPPSLQAISTAETQRQQLIMLQNASTWVSRGYFTWVNMPEETRGTFSSHLAAIKEATLHILAWYNATGSKAPNPVTKDDLGGDENAPPEKE